MSRPPPSIETAQASSDPAGQLRLLTLGMQTTRLHLMRIDPDALDNADHATWTQQLYDVSVAINTLRNAALGALSAEFAAKLPHLAVATTQLADELKSLEEATDVIRAVGSSLDLITSIAVLLP